MNEYKIVLIGDCGVGKTSILERLINNTYDDAIQSTIGFSNQIYQLNCNDTIYQINFIDITGQINYKNVMPFYFQNCSFALAVFDITNESTLENLETWIKIFKEHGNEHTDVLIVGNKIDLENQIDDEKIKDEIKKLGIDYDNRYVKVSAKNGNNYSYFLSYLSNLVEEFRENQNPIPNKIDLTIIPDNKHCCKF